PLPSLLKASTAFFRMVSFGWPVSAHMVAGPAAPPAGVGSTARPTRAAGAQALVRARTTARRRRELSRLQGQGMYGGWCAKLSSILQERQWEPHRFFENFRSYRKFSPTIRIS